MKSLNRKNMAPLSSFSDHLNKMKSPSYYNNEIVAILDHNGCSFNIWLLNISQYILRTVGYSKGQTSLNLNFFLWEATFLVLFISTFNFSSFPVTLV